MAEGQKFSDDVEVLRSVVELDTNPAVIRWEIFSTPEYVGGVPGPTDFVTLVAEVPRFDQGEFEKRAKSGTKWIAPEASRPWLSENLRLMLGKHRNAAVDLSSHHNCRAAYGKLKKSRRQVEGFVCNGPSSGLIYLTLVGSPNA
jgi:hypothetical protein